MNAEKFIKEMYYNVWQGNDLSKIDDYYAKEVEATMCVSDDNKNPLDVTLHYDDVVKRAKWQQEHFEELVFDFKVIVAGEDQHISAIYYLSATEKKTGEKKQFRVSGIWQLNQDNKIKRVWAVLAPFYPFQ